MMDHPDSQTIAAVRTGEVDRFRELVQRYERHVYAVAWARLGDATLAEDATQESFIRAYRLLGWLRDPARFAGWITRITRAVSINLGLRHRRELRRRERWAVDSAPEADASTSPDPGSPGDPNDLPIPPDTLRAALGDLPTRHRECLVLFYLEGRPVTEAAEALGISEGAFKVRLHRARHALRGRLERHLECSLGRLAPRRSLAPGIMSSILLKSAASDPTGTTTGVLAVLGASLAKLLPLPILFLLVPAAAVTAGVGATSWATRAERGNYLDTAGFRRRLYDDDQQRVRGLWAVMALITVGVLALGSWLAQSFAFEMYLYVPCLVGWFAVTLRRFQLNPRLQDWVRFGTLLPLLTYFVLAPLYEMPLWVLPIVFGVHYLGLTLYPPDRPLRFDYNLFLRERLGLLPASHDASTQPTTSLVHPTPSLPPSSLWAFAQFGAQEGLFTAFRRLPHQTGVRLKLRPVALSVWDWLWPWPRRQDSTLTLRTNGTVEASLGSRDADSLDRLGIPATRDPETHRHAIEASARAALLAHAAGDIPTALRDLGHTADREIFKVDPARTGFPRIQRFAGVAGLVLIACLFYFSLSASNRHGNLQIRAAHLEPVPYGLEDAKAIFGALGVGPSSHSRRRWDAIQSALYSGYVLPPLAWACSEGQTFVRTNWFSFPVDQLPQTPFAAVESMKSWQRLKALHFGWPDPQEAAAFHATAPQWRTLLAAIPPHERQALLEPETIPIANPDGSLIHLNPLRWRIATLKDLGLLDLFDHEPLLARLQSHQVLPGKPIPPERVPLADRRPWTGLFRTRGSDPIAETYEVLAILEDLGAVHTIDVAACAKGMLQLHLGKGLFLAPMSGDRPFARRPRRGNRGWQIHIPGDARTTYAARESLRILGALERVPDLAEWQYRIHTTHVPPDLSNAHRGPGAWSRVEAALLQHQVR